jgi:hypothetical protein
VSLIQELNRVRSQPLTQSTQQGVVWANPPRFSERDPTLGALGVVLDFDGAPQDLRGWTLSIRRKQVVQAPGMTLTVELDPQSMGELHSGPGQVKHPIGAYT